VRLRRANAPVVTAEEEITLDYSRGGRSPIKVKLANPVAIAVANKPQPWGYFQFPIISREPDDAISVKWSMKQDSVVGYGKAAGAVSAVSRDRGRTWEPYRWQAPGSIQTETGDVYLPNGDRLQIATPEAIKTDTLNLPPPVGSTLDVYTKTKRLFYPLSELPPAVQGVFFKRSPKGTTDAIVEHAKLEDPRGLRDSVAGLMPIVWWGDLHLAPDDSIIAGTYPGYASRADGSVDPFMAASFYRSTDNGHSWKIQGRIPYQPDLHADPRGAERQGFTEPAFEFLDDGSLLCVMRTTDSTGTGPLYICYSSDLGVTWTKPEVVANSGIMPRLLRLANGVVVLSTGRPGVQLRFCAGGKGRRWTVPLEVLPYKNENDQVTCGYTGLLASGPDRFLLVYSDFKHLDEAKQLRKAH